MNDNEVKAEDDAKNQKVLQNINKNKEITDTEITEEDLKKMKTLFCIDASESVKGKTTYHNVTKNIFNKFCVVLHFFLLSLKKTSIQLVLCF